MANTWVKSAAKLSKASVYWTNMLKDTNVCRHFINEPVSFHLTGQRAFGCSKWKSYAKSLTHMPWIWLLFIHIIQLSKLENKWFTRSKWYASVWNVFWWVERYSSWFVDKICFMSFISYSWNVFVSLLISVYSCLDDYFFRLLMYAYNHKILKPK